MAGILCSLSCPIVPGTDADGEDVARRQDLSVLSPAQAPQPRVAPRPLTAAASGRPLHLATSTLFRPHTPLHPWMSGAALEEGKMIICSCRTRGQRSGERSGTVKSRARAHRERVSVDGDRFQPEFRERAVLVVDLATLECVERVKAVDDLAEHRVCGRAASGSEIGATGKGGGRGNRRVQEGGGEGGAQLLSRCGCLA